MKNVMDRGLRGFAVVTVSFGLLSCGGGGGAAAPTAEQSCTALASMSIAASAIGRPTSGAIVQSATLVAATAQGNTNGEYCAVTGMIFPASAGAPTMEFQVNLPSTWNRKALQMGGGGYDGSLQTGLGRFTSQPNGAQNALARGYVTLGGDGGHKGSVFDGTFALNDEALLNYGQLSVKKVHDVAAAIIEKRYGAKPSRFYFIGGSQGGHEGLDAAARYGADYDGVVAHYPAYNISLLQQASLAVGRALYDNGGAGWINNAKRQLLVNATYAACDALDGATDGIVGNIAACNTSFNIDTVRATLRCPGGVDTGDGCLSDAQIEAVRKIASPFDIGFPIAGQQVFGRWPLLEGAEFGFGAGSAFGTAPVPTFAAAVPADAQATLDKIAKGVRYFGCDLNKLAETEAAVGKLADEVGGIDVLVNNAALVIFKSFEKFSIEEYEDQVRINSSAVFVLSRAVSKAMIPRNYGKIINVTSLTLTGRWEGYVPYIASKGAMFGLIKGLARELGAHCINVNGISPGAVVSEAEFRDRGDKREEYHQWILENQSMKKRIQAVDIANLAVFLSTSQSDLITGQNIQVDGGW